MQQQNRILETVSSPEGLTRVSALMSAESFSHRTAVADRVCKAFGFSDARGRRHRAGCLKALRALDAKGCIALPAPRHRGGQPRGLGQAVAAPSGVPDRVNEVEDLVLILVSSAEQRRVWNELMAREHPQGAARHVGAQVRYLILSRHGCLGAFGFAASALMLAARDRWIGWDPALRAQQLHRVVAMSRFLIRPGVRCHNLASKVLGMCLRRLGTVDLLVRAKHNRSLGKDLPKLFDAVQAKPVQAHLEMHVARSSARRGTRRQKARAGRKAREAKLALRWCAVQLPVPSKSSCQGPGPLQLSLVHVCEESAPDNLEPLEWFLLTSLPVTSRQQALKILEWYRLRWRIEDWHRVLKSGCKVEYLGHRTGERIERAVTINAVIAWCLTAMTLLGRDTPELPADILFSDIEIIALEDFAKDRKLPPPDNLGRAVLILAMLGGYLNRKRDPPPGYAKLWEGYTRLATTAQTYERLLRLDRTSDFYKRLRSDKTCG